MSLELSVIMPCLDEEKTVGICVQKARECMKAGDIKGEIIVADNGSKDRSREISRQAGARVVDVKEKGYGAAIRGGLCEAQGKYVVMGDADDSYDFEGLVPFVEKLRNGCDLVMGNRFQGGIAKGAMPLLHKYLGNPVLSFVGRVFFRIRIGDFHCGLRGFNRERINALELTASGMEFASEMVIKAAMRKYLISEVPTTLKPDGRDREPHLRSWRDGWRHLRLMLMLSPRWLFLYPGILMLVPSLYVLLGMLLGEVQIRGVLLGINSMLYAGIGVVISQLFIGMAFVSRKVGEKMGVFERQWMLDRLSKYMSLEKGLILGGSLFLIGLVLSIIITGEWVVDGFQERNPDVIMRTIIPASILMMGGVITMVFSFMLDIVSFYDENKRNKL